MKSIAVLCLVLSGLSGFACSRQLTRDQARDLIIKKRELPQAVTSSVDHGMFWPQEAGQPYVHELEHNAIASGLLRVRPTGRTKSCECGWGGHGGGLLYETAVEFTPAAAQYVIGAPQSLDDEGRLRTSVRRCEEEFGEITGITGDEKSAQVEYTTKYVRPTGFRYDNDDCRNGKLFNKSASFQKYDDGWRIAD